MLNKTGNPPLTNCMDSTENGTGQGVFNVSLTGLQDNRVYYIVAFAKNQVELLIVILSGSGLLHLDCLLSRLLPLQISHPLRHSVEVQSPRQGTGHLEKGVCWNSTGIPTLKNNHTSDGTGTGDFTSHLYGLRSGVQYYVRAFARNEKDTSYGDTVNFRTFICGTSVLYGNQYYPAVTI